VHAIPIRRSQSQPRWATTSRRAAHRDIATLLAEIPGVVAVTLGGSRATGTADEDSDWDFGLVEAGSDLAALVAETARVLDLEGTGWGPA